VEGAVKRILMIDDDEEMCEELSQILRDEGYSVAIAFDGLTGSELLLRNEYDLVILDIKMPGINGVEILKMAKDKKLKGKILVVTGSFLVNKLLKEGNVPEEGESVALLKLADCLMSKPFDIPTLLERVNELLS
jgi:DNA-binding response OmpR family regulator